MPICPNCKTEVEAGVKFCMECGSPIPQNKVCPRCGTELPLAAKFCFGCGANLAGGNAPAVGLDMGDNNVVAGDVIGQKVAGDNVSSKVMGNVIHNTIKDDTKSVNTCSICGVHMTNDIGHTCPKCGKVVCAEHFDKKFLCCKACAEKQQASMGVELCGVCGRRLIPGTGYVCRLCGKPTCEKHFDDDMLCCKACAMEQKKQAATAEQAKREAEEAARKAAEDDNSFTDPRDGQVYKTVKIGNQVWLDENFRYKCDGSYAYGDDNKNIKKYGRLYTWDAAMKCAPSGWHLPSREEWNNLLGYVEANANAEVGTALKSETGWVKYEDTPRGSDEFGFCALPAGFRNIGGGFGSLGEDAYFWTSTEYDGGNAFGRYLCYGHVDFKEYWCSKAVALSIRLLRD